MIYLLDTHALLWWLEDNKKLPAKSRHIITNDENDIFVSLATGWEIAIKAALGKLEDIGNFQSEIKIEGFALLAISFDHIEKVKTLPHHHRDPFDRMLVAQALTEDLTLLSNETLFDAYGVRRVWD
jgi:PIN domain nuclease of toxin-antitoxin system